MSNLTNSSSSKDIRIWENVKIFVKKNILVSAIPSVPSEEEGPR